MTTVARMAQASLKVNGFNLARNNIPIGMSIGCGIGVCVGGIVDAINRRKAEKESDDTGEAEG